MTMEFDLATLFGERLGSDMASIGLPRDKLVDQKRLFRHRVRRLRLKSRAGAPSRSFRIPMPARPR